MENTLKVNVEIPFPSKRLAEISYHVLRVDSEPKRSGIQKQLTLKDSVLQVELFGAAAKQLRVAVNSLFDSISLITETIDFAGDPVSEKYDHFI